MRAIGAFSVFVWATLVFGGSVLAEDELGVVDQVDGRQIKITAADTALVPRVGDRIEIYIEVPDVGVAVVGTAMVTSIDGAQVQARVERATGSIKPKQKVRAISRPASSGDAGSLPLPEPVKTDQQLIQGAWENVATLLYGEPSQEHVGVIAVFEGDQLTWIFPEEDGRRRLQGKFFLDPTKSPKHFDWFPGGMPRIYEIRGDTLLHASNLKAVRPPDFESAKFQFTGKRCGPEKLKQIEQWAREDEAAFQAAFKAAEAGDAAAQYTVGQMHRLGRGVPASLVEAAPWFYKAANQGNADAQYNLGRMYLAGKGATRNPAEAHRWFLAAAKGGNTNAQFRLGLMYETGTGVTQNYSEAVRWYRAAAEADFSPAMVNLGWDYEQGRGVTASAREAYRWYLKAGQAGDPAGQYQVGRVCVEGKGVRRDEKIGLQWLLAAAKKGEARAQNYVGFMYQNGMGTAQNLEEAVRWYRRAAAQGNQQAVDNLQAMGRNP